MKKLASGFLLIGVNLALAGDVNFTPGEISVFQNPLGTFIDVQVTVEPVAPSFTEIRVLLGSDDVPLIDFELNPGWISPGGFTDLEGPLIQPGLGIYPYEVLFGGSVSSGEVTADKLVAGILTLDLSNLPPGDYTVVVNPDRDGDLSGVRHQGGLEPLNGTLLIHIVPEPGAIALLALAAPLAFGYSRRRR